MKLSYSYDVVFLLSSSLVRLRVLGALVVNLPRRQRQQAGASRAGYADRARQQKVRSGPIDARRGERHEQPPPAATIVSRRLWVSGLSNDNVQEIPVSLI